MAPMPITLSRPLLSSTIVGRPHIIASIRAYGIEASVPDRITIFPLAYADRRWLTGPRNPITSACVRSSMSTVGPATSTRSVSRLGADCRQSFDQGAQVALRTQPRDDVIGRFATDDGTAVRVDAVRHQRQPLPVGTVHQGPGPQRLGGRGDDTRLLVREPGQRPEEAQQHRPNRRVAKRMGEQRRVQVGLVLGQYIRRTQPPLGTERHQRGEPGVGGVVQLGQRQLASRVDVAPARSDWPPGARRRVSVERASPGGAG